MIGCRENLCLVADTSISALGRTGTGIRLGASKQYQRQPLGPAGDFAIAIVPERATELPSRAKILK